jgi:hypothetical protein
VFHIGCSIQAIIDSVSFAGHITCRRQTIVIVDGASFSGHVSYYLFTKQYERFGVCDTQLRKYSKSPSSFIKDKELKIYMPPPLSDCSNRWLATSNRHFYQLVIQRPTNITTPPRRRRLRQTPQPSSHFFVNHIHTDP